MSHQMLSQKRALKFKIMYGVFCKFFLILCPHCFELGDLNTKTQDNETSEMKDVMTGFLEQHTHIQLGEVCLPVARGYQFKVRANTSA